ncbi:hypothetical protein [Polaribacter porphyrae]|uniref:Uncharacterized protein n=1 Tax=Polaribacter porphyrae TaxID=1137780 RepID=A0A2S7WS10_9FLAO|nr:hypothetical protein [Polaribacter porphyrae]PQJ80379.1 hypothetical protein BTO18_14870 [Polaribacter porphyrae]
MNYLARRPFLVIFLFTLILIAILDLVFNVNNIFIRNGLAVALAVFLSPRKKKIETQTGTKTQITWIFLKESIIID